MTPDILSSLLDAAARRRPVALAERLTDGLTFLLPDPAAPDAVAARGAEMLAADRTGTVEIDGADWFVESRNPKPRALVVGAVHIAQSLVPLMAQSGFDVVVIDPRRAFASDERFPGVSVRTDWPDEALDSLVPDAGSAVVTLTHDPKLDDPALLRALASKAFYVGALGSKKTHARRCDRLRAAGIGETALARIHAPIGLDIGAVTAPEIALSIAAEIVAARRGPKRDRPKAEAAA